jgi:putative transposase
MSAIERKLALERFRLLEPHLQNGRELRSVSEGSGVTFRTLQRWVANYKRQGLAGLVRKERTDVGERRTTSPRMREAIEGLALEKPPLPLSSVHRQAKQFAQMIGEPAPTYWIVRDIVRSLPSDLRTLA